MGNLLSPRIPFREYAQQYLVGNLLSAVAAIIGGVTAHQLTGSSILAAIAATVCNDVVWYLYMWLYYLGHGDKAGQAIRHLVTDFGLAEALDSLVIRPVLFYILPKFTHGQASGILVATIMADVIYTSIAINRQRRRAV